MGVAVRPLVWAWQICLLAGLLGFCSSQEQLPQDYDLRLVDGTASSEGRLEILYQGEWGTICKRTFKDNEAQVACRQLGYPYATRVKRFSPGTGRIVMKYVKCNGNENKVMDCYYELDVEFCDHDDDVGVVCSNVQTTEAPPDIDQDHIDLLNLGKLRLVGGPDPYEGRVEVYNIDIRGWATFCVEHWDFRKAELACKNLGYRPATSTGTLRYGAGTGPIANCPASENRLKTLYCEILNETDPTNTCNHDMDVDVVCSGTEPGRQGEVRLVNGVTELEGRVEIYDQNVWKTLCSDDWGIEEVRATCQQLGMPEPSASTIPPGGSFGVSVANEILQESITCTGQERSLQNCTWSSSVTMCNTGGASAQCGVRQEAQEFDLRLADGRTSSEGRVEMLYQGEWGTVCRVSFKTPEATVVCNQLGFQYALRKRDFGPGSGKVILQRINCNGNEESLLDCYHVLTTNCDHRDDVGVVCSNLPREMYQPYLYPGDLRLGGGPNPYEGRVEMYFSEDIGWVTICRENWEFKEAEFACRELEYRPATSVGTMRYGAGTGPIAICPSASPYGLGTENCKVVNDSDPTVTCNHDMNVDVVCSGTERGYQGAVVLLNGTEKTEGRIEFFNNNVFKRVCSDNWGMEEAKILCYQLGKPVPTKTVSGGMFGGNEDKTYLQESFNCTGHEINIEQCMSTLRQTQCVTGDAGVQCGVWKDAKEGDLRLSGGRQVTAGRLEIYHAGQWGRVCTGSWDEYDSHVACRQLGYLTVVTTYVDYLSTVRLDPIWLSSLGCSGVETSLMNCTHSFGSSSLCRFFDDIALECDPRPSADTLEVRLVNGPYPNQGLVQVQYNGAWSTVCDIGWDMFDAEVICRQLGFQSAVIALDGYDNRELYGSGDGDILFYDLACKGPETNVSDCFYKVPRYYLCNHDYDAGVVCYSEDYPSIDPRKVFVPPTFEDEGLSSSMIRNIIIGVIVLLKLFLFVCWACYKYNKKKDETTVVEVTTNETSGGNQYHPVGQTEDAPPDYEDVTKNKSRFPAVSVESSPPPPAYNSPEHVGTAEINQTTV